MSLLLAPIYPQGAPAPGAVALADADIVGHYYAAWEISQDGFTYFKINNTSPLTPQGPAWIAPQVGMDLYECRATATGLKHADGSPYDTWIDLAQGAAWSMSAARTAAVKQATFQLDIRQKSDGTIVATANITIEADGDAA